MPVAMVLAQQVMPVQFAGASQTVLAGNAANASARTDAVRELMDALKAAGMVGAGVQSTCPPAGGIGGAGTQQFDAGVAAQVRELDGRIGAIAQRVDELGINVGRLAKTIENKSKEDSERLKRIEQKLFPSAPQPMLPPVP